MRTRRHERPLPDAAPLLPPMSVSAAATWLDAPNPALRSLRLALYTHVTKWVLSTYRVLASPTRLEPLWEKILDPTCP